MQGESIEPFAQTQAVADQIRAFAAGIFRHASDGVIISLRIFAEGDKGEKPLAIQGIPINGGGLEPLSKPRSAKRGSRQPTPNGRCSARPWPGSTTTTRPTRPA